MATIATAAAQQQQQHHQFAAVAALALQQQLAGVTDHMNLSNPLLSTFCGSPSATSSASINSASQLYSTNQSIRTPTATVLAQQLTSIPPTGRYFTTHQNLIPSIGVAQPIHIPLAAASVVAESIPKQPEGPDGANLFIYHLPGKLAVSSVN